MMILETWRQYSNPSKTPQASALFYGFQIELRLNFPGFVKNVRHVWKRFSWRQRQFLCGRHGWDRSRFERRLHTVHEILVPIEREKNRTLAIRVQNDERGFRLARELNQTLKLRLIHTRLLLSFPAELRPPSGRCSEESPRSDQTPWCKMRGLE